MALAIDELVAKATTTTTTESAIIPKYWAAKIEKNLRLQAIFDSSIVSFDDLAVPHSGDTLYVPVLPDFGVADTLTEGTDMTVYALTTASTIPFVPTEYGKVVEATRKVLDRIKYNGVEEIMDRLAYSISQTIQSQIAALYNKTVPSLGGSLTQIYANGHTSATIVATDLFNDKLILDGVAQLESVNNVPFEDGYYRLFMSPVQYAALLQDSNTRQDLRFASPARLLTNEKGALHGCRIITTNYVPSTGNAYNNVAQQNTTNVACALLVAPRWAAVAWKRHPEAYVDPTLYDGGRRRRFGITGDWDIELLHSERAVVLVSALAD